jgi:hypothetical protein
VTQKIGHEAMDNTRTKHEKDLAAGKENDDSSLFEFSSESSTIASEPNPDWIVPAARADPSIADTTPSRPTVSESLSPFELAHRQREGSKVPHVQTTSPPAGHSSPAAPHPRPAAVKREPASESGARARSWQQLTRTQWLLAAAVVLALGEAVFIASQRFGPWRPGTTAAAPSSESRTTTASATNTTGRQAPQAAAIVGESKGTTGQSSSVMIRSNPPGARVWIDGRPRGQTPLTVGLLSPGQHELILQGATGRVQQRIELEPGGKATVVATLAGIVSGSIAVQARTELQIMEGGKLVGSTRTEKILLNAGRHTLDLVNESLGYQSRQVVDVTPGKTTVLAPQLPKGMFSANARPWAEVFIDGEQVGETPLGNVPLEIGPHEITFRHPELGEAKRTVTVTLRGPARVSVDLQRQDR